jgi:acylphosphatase
MVHYQIKVSGRVQGVWFRKSTQQEAQRIGIKGFVRNEKDGSVFVEASAEEGAMSEFMDWLKIGPPMARVDGISAIPYTPEKIYDGFNITY